MKGIIFIILLFFAFACSENKNTITVEPNHEITLNYPKYFPVKNQSFIDNKPTKYGVILGKKLFNDKRLSINNTISCASCHIQSHAFADTNPIARGVFSKIALRNVPPLQNLAFMKFYMWDGNHLSIENQVLIPIITKEEMGSNILEVINKIKDDDDYKDLFTKTFGNQKITGDRIYKSIAQFEYTLISVNSKYDKIKRNEGEKFTQKEAEGYKTFKQKCSNCHNSELFTDESFRNIGFPINPNTEETGRARVTQKTSDYLKFRVPSLRNVEYTAPYGSFGQFDSLKEVLDYFDNGVLNSNNLDPFFKKNNNRIPLTETEKENIIAFLKTLSDKEFVSINKKI